MIAIEPDEIVNFIRETHPLKAWRESKVLSDWVAWMLAHGCMEAFTDTGEKLDVLLSARITSADKTEDDFDINPDGDCLVIDLMLTRQKHHLDLGVIAEFLEGKYGMPDSVHWKRGNRGSRTYTAPHILKRLNYKDRN